MINRFMHNKIIQTPRRWRNIGEEIDIKQVYFGLINCFIDKHGLKIDVYKYDDGNPVSIL